MGKATATRRKEGVRSVEGTRHKDPGQGHSKVCVRARKKHMLYCTKHTVQNELYSIICYTASYNIFAHSRVPGLCGGTQCHQDITVEMGIGIAPYRAQIEIVVIRSAHCKRAEVSLNHSVIRVLRIHIQDSAIL
jgi:hypothetical protein